MGGEYFRYLHRKPEKKFGEAEKQQYKKALPELIGCYEKWHLRKLPSVIENIRYVVDRNSRQKNGPSPTSQLTTALGDTPSACATALLMSSRREGAAFSCLPMDVLHKLLDMAFLRMSTVVAGYMDRHNHPGIVVGKLVLYIWCPRPYHEDALCLPRELDDFPKTLGWQHFSRTRDTDPLHGLVDDCINILRRFLPDTFDLHEWDNNSDSD